MQNNSLGTGTGCGIVLQRIPPNVMIQHSFRRRHNGHDGVSNHQPHHCLLNRLFGCRSKKTSTLRVTGLCAGNSPGAGEFPAQMASNAENVSIWWRHHVVGAERLQPITWAYVDPYLCRHMASLGHNELIIDIHFIYIPKTNSNTSYTVIIHFLYF